jgi:hypothetical protein
MSRQNTNPKIMSSEQVTDFFIKKSKRNWQRAKLDLKKIGCVDNIKTTTPLFKELGIDRI